MYTVNMKLTRHLSKHVSQSSQSFSIQFHLEWHEGPFQKKVHSQSMGHGWNEDTQFLEKGSHLTTFCKINQYKETVWSVS